MQTEPTMKRDRYTRTKSASVRRFLPARNKNENRIYLYLNKEQRSSPEPQRGWNEALTGSLPAPKSTFRVRPFSEELVGNFP